ncbi:MAG: hypothetical protein KBC84_06120 [Proteobacteria bacterium]|nr:hypothetical protein [Pseudomonadota bacterium]
MNSLEDVTQNIKFKGKVWPLDVGVAFAFKHLNQILIFSLPASIVVSFLSYVNLFFPLNYQQSFLLGAINLCVVTWLLVAVMLFSIKKIQGQAMDWKIIAIDAVIVMPKVIISYAFLVLIILSFAALPFLLFFVLFLFWAPFYSAAELAIKKNPVEDEEDDDEQSDLFSDTEEDIPFVKRKLTFFENKPIWDLGFSRSTNFVSKYYLITIALIMLIWISMILPRAIAVKLGGIYLSYPYVVIEVFLSFALYAIILCIASVSFLMAHPKEAFKEFGIDEKNENFQKLSQTKVARNKSRLLVFFCLLLVGIFATGPVWKFFINQRTAPASLVTTVEKIEVNEKQLILNVILKDDSNLFRWLEPTSFRLEVEDENYVMPEKEKDLSQIEDALLSLQLENTDFNKLIVPDRVMAYSLKNEGSSLVLNEELGEDNFAPHQGDIKIAVSFPNRLKDKAKKTKFSLYHLSIIGDKGKAIAEGFFNGN